MWDAEGSGGDQKGVGRERDRDEHDQIKENKQEILRTMEKVKQFRPPKGAAEI